MKIGDVGEGIERFFGNIPHGGVFRQLGAEGEDLLIKIDCEFGSGGDALHLQSGRYRIVPPGRDCVWYPGATLMS